MNKLFTVFLALLILSSCKDKETEKEKEKEKPTVLVSKITLQPNPATVAVGAKLKLIPTVMPDDAANKTLTWESMNPTLATVDSHGEVTGVAVGLALITAIAADDSRRRESIVLSVKNNEASVSAITLGAEKFNIPIPADGSTTITLTLNNAPHTLSSIITAVPVDITATNDATITIGTKVFRQEQEVDFTNPVKFTVTAQDGVTTKTYTLAITAYNASTNPYGVYTAIHLNDVRNDKAGSYLMMNNIDLPTLNDVNMNFAASAATGIKDYFAGGWIPIAHDALLTEAETVTVIGGFTGTFDGGNFSINNLYINRGIGFAGLFGITSGATLKNLGITGATSPITATSKYAGALAGVVNRGSVTNCHAVNFSISFGTYLSYSSTGGLVGRSYSGTISNCYAMGSVSAHVSGSSTGSPSVAAGGLVGRSDEGIIHNCYTTGNVSVSSSTSAAGGLVGHSDKDKISNCYTTGSVSAYASVSASAGGLVGISDNEISNCYAMGNVSASSAYTTTSHAGGLVGVSYNKISNCYATGSVSSSNSTAGGLVGYINDRAVISNCYATGSVSIIASDNSPSAGGLVGKNEGGIHNCYATGSVSSSHTAGGLVGKNEEGNIRNCYATGNVSASHNVGGLVGNSGHGNINNCYRNSDAEIKKAYATANPTDISITGKRKRDMRTEAFTTSLNEGTTVWGRSTGKNDDLPYITGVGVGKN